MLLEADHKKVCTVPLGLIYSFDFRSRYYFSRCLPFEPFFVPGSESILMWLK